MAINRVNQLLGKYRLTAYLGKGGFAEVYLGEHQNLKRYAALKVLHVTLTQEMVDAFLLEAQTLAQLEHPNIVRVLDYDTQDNTPFIVMDYVPGGTLRDHIPRGTRLPLSTIVFYVKQIASALQFAHNRSIIHRDIKPDNMLLATEEQIRLSDFGLALFASNQLSTQPGMEGTIRYSAPEQLQGKPVFASDQYSLGIVTYEWLCGVRPFERGNVFQIADQHLRSLPRPLHEIRPDLPQAVEAVVLRALAKEPQQRYPDVQSFSRALEHACRYDTFEEEDTEITSPRRAIPKAAVREEHAGPPADPRRGAFTRVFLSYPSTNEDFAKRLKADLSKQSVSFTNDHVFGPADQHDPEQIMQQAIRAAHAVLVVDSEATRTSKLVIKHLRTIATYQKPFAYVWISGPGAASLPSDFPLAKVIDARQNRYSQALEEVIAYLNEDDIPTAGKVAVAPQAGREPRNPYKGLQPFEMDEAGDFFGRKRLLDILMGRLQKLVTEPPHKAGNRLLALIGPSGSGKSSAMRAGLLPRLQQNRIPGSKQWIYLKPMRPAQHPGESLALILAEQMPRRGPQSIYADLGEESARALHMFAASLAQQIRQPDPRTGARVVLLIDQFEEVFSPLVSERERQHFLDLLTTAATEPGGPLVVLLTLRADFYGHTMQYRELSHLIEANRMPVPPMDLDDLRDVIEGPAALPDVQVSFEGNLAGDLLFEAQGQAGSLPLLEFTLYQLFQLREGNMLTLPAYEQIGGVKGALVKCAEDVYSQLPNEEYRTLTRALFLRLIDPGPTPQDATRRRAALSELALPDEKQRTIMATIADAFVAARLLVASEQGGERTIEVSHEALIERWPRLFAWLREAGSDIVLQRTISNDASEWLRRGRPVDRLYRDSELIEALAWGKRNFPSQDEADFLRASVAEQNRRENEERMRLQEQIRIQQEQIKLRDNITKHQSRLLRVLSIATIIVIILGSLATYSYSNAKEESLKNASRVLAFSADQALTQHKIDLALLLSIKASQEYDTPEARNSLFNALMQSPHLAAILNNGYNHPDGARALRDPLQALAFSKDGQGLLAYNGTQLYQWTVHTHSYQPIDLHKLTGTSSFSADHRVLGIANPQGVWMVDLQSGNARSLPVPPILNIPSGIIPESLIAFSNDASLVAASRCYGYSLSTYLCDKGSVFIWPTQKAVSVPSFSYPVTTRIIDLALSSDGKLLALAVPTKIQILDTRTTDVIASLPMDNADATSLAFSPNDTLLAAGSEDKTIHLWKTSSWESLLPLSGSGQKQEALKIAFSHNGKFLASANQDGTIYLWTVDTGQNIPFIGHNNPVLSVAFNDDDTMLASGGKDGSLMLWNISAEGTINRRLADPLADASGTHSILCILFSFDGKKLFIGTEDGRVLLVDSSTGKVQKLPTETVPESDGSDGAIVSIAMSSKAKKLVAGRANGTILLWDVQDMQKPKILWPSPLQYSGHLTKVTLSADGEVLAAGGDGKAVMLWNLSSPGKATLLPVYPTSGIGAPIALSNDGKLLAAGSCTTSDCRIPEVVVWTLGTARPRSLIGRPEQVAFQDLDFSPDSSILAASNFQGITLWDTTKYTATTLSDSHSTIEPGLYYQTIHFSPDGRQLLSSSRFDDTTFAFVIWNVSQQEQFVPPFSEGPPNDSDISQGSLAFSPDSQHLVSVFTRDRGRTSSSNILLLWDITTSAWISRGCDIAHRDLTPTEWDQFLKDEQPRTQVC